MLTPSARFFYYYSFAALLVSTLLASNVYRAQKQSITIDEAFTFNEFVAPPFSQTMGSYDANNHILFTLLAKFTTSVFGPSEFTLRLPTLIAGVVFLLVLCVLSARAFGPTPLFAVAISLTALNPFLGDYLSAARGYGLGLAFWFTGLLAFQLALRRSHSHWLMSLGCLSAMLALTANLTFTFPSFGLLGTVFLLLGWRQGYRAAPYFLVPILLVGSMLWMSPLRKAQPRHFYHGSNTVSQCVQSLGSYTFFYRSNTFNLDGKPYWINWPHRRVLARLQMALLLLAAGATATMARAIVRAKRAAGPVDELSLLITLLGGSSIIGALLLCMVHVAFGVKYPSSRAGLFWIVSTSFLAPLLASKLKKNFPAFRPIVGLLTVCGFFCAAYLASEIRTTDYAEWRFDVGTRDIALVINAQGNKETSTRVGASWLLASSLDFYRRIWRLPWEPVRRLSKEQLALGARAGLFDYLVLLPQDHAILPEAGWRTVLHDSRTGAIVLLRSSGCGPRVIAPSDRRAKAITP